MTATSPTATFIARWPITEPHLTLQQLVQSARPDLPDLATRAHARLVGAGRWTIAASADVPGSGMVTPTVLLYRAPCVPVPRRPYSTRLSKTG